MARRYEDLTKKELIAELRRKEATAKRDLQLDELVHQVDSHRSELRAQTMELIDAQRGLEEALNRYADLYDFAPVAYVSLSMGGLIEEANLTATTFLECDRSALIGLPLLNLIALQDRTLILRHLASCRSGRPLVSTQLRVRRRRSGELVDVEVFSRIASAYSPGQSRFLRTALIDLSAQKAMERALVAARDELEQRVLERTRELRDANALLGAEIERRNALEVELTKNAQLLGDADRRKDEFLAMLAHELRNPLAPLLSGLELQKHSGVPKEERRRVQDAMLRQVRHMARLIDDLLDVGRISRGKIGITKQPVELAELVERALESVRPFFDVAHHALEVSLPEEALWLAADPVRIVQVVANLLQNAAKFTSQGGKIMLRADRAGDRARVAVHDSGIGMSDAAMAHVFEPFFQADRSLDRSKGGLGLGLTLARALVELHGGTISARSDGVGKGSEFTVELPLLEKAPALERPRIGDGHAAARKPKDLRLLVVDDNADAADGLTALLVAEGYAVRTAYNAHGGLELAEKERLDVALLDIGLPGVDGYELAMELRRRFGDALTLIAVTGYGEETARARAKAAGFSFHVLKPLGLEELEELLSRVAAERAESSARADPAMANRFSS